ncbi:hypothetical protein V9J89_003428 [Vibrio cholerae]
MDIRLFTRFLFLAFCFLFSASSFSSDRIPTIQLYTCTIIPSNLPTGLEDSKSIQDCYQFAPQSSNYQHCDSSALFDDGSRVRCNHKLGPSYGSLQLVRRTIYMGCPSGYDKVSEYYCVKNNTPQCNSDQVLDPSTNTCVPAPTCPAEGTKDKSSYGPPNLLGFSACTANNCIIQVGTTDGLSLCTGGGTADEQCAYTTYYTGQACTYNPDNTTWNPPGHEWPEVPKPDLPVPDQPDLPLPDSGGGNGGYDPDAGIEDNFTPPNPDTSPDTDNPNLGAEGNAGVVNELNSANKSLQNIEAILTQTRKDQNENAAIQERYNSGILGAINSIDKSVSGASGSGGGGGNGDGDSGSGCDPEKEQCESGLNFGRPEVKDPFENILDASDIAEVQAKTTDIKTSLKSKIDEIKNLISVPKYETGGSVPAVEFSLQHGNSNIQVKNDALSRISPDIANIITLVVAVICFGIVAARR